MSSKNKKELVDELMNVSEEENDFFGKPIKKKKKASHKEIDLGTYIPDTFEKDPAAKEKNITKDDVDSFITDITMPLPSIKDKMDPEFSKEGYPTNSSKKDNIYYKKNAIENIDHRKQEPKNEKSKFRIFISFLFTLMFIASLVYMGYALLFGSTQIKQTELIINSILLVFLSLLTIIGYGAKNEKKKNRIAFIEGILMTGFLLFNILSVAGIVQLPQNTVMKDFTGKDINEVLKWAEANHIAVEQTYDDSDVTEEYHVIKQSIYPNVLASSIKTLELTVSSGPDYEKEVVIPDMTGWNIDEAVKTIDENFLNNVDVSFEINEDTEKDIIIEQSKKGNMKRKDEIHLTVSLGTKDTLNETEMIDLKNMSKFKATLWLKRNAIAYKDISEFSVKVKRNHVINQSIQKGTKIKPNEQEVELKISKGKKIVVPDLAKMSMKKVTKWITENRLKIEFSDRYDMKIKKGKVMETNYKEKDEIEEGTLIQITISKGQLKLPKFDDIDAFRSWANKYAVRFKEEYISNKDIEKGKIIKFSAEPGDVLNTKDEIIVYISSGDMLVVPNFVGKSKGTIEKECKEASLQCTFYYAGNSSKEKDIALSQNKTAGSEVIKDTYVNIGLSSGKNTNNSNVNTGNKPNNGGNTSTGGGSKPTPTPTPKPSCDFIRNLNLQSGYTGTETKQMLIKLNSGINFSWNPVNACSNGDRNSGTICSSSKADGASITTCNNAVTITYVN